MKNILIESEIIADIVSSRYTIGKLTNCQLIREGFNHNYLVETNEKKYVLRVYMTDKYYVRDADDFRFELALLNYLLDQGLSVAQPVTNNEGEWLTTQQLVDKSRHMALFHFAPGVELDKAGERGDLEPNDIWTLGQLTARLHQAMDGFQSRYHRYHLNCSTYLLDKSLEILETHLAKRNMGNVSFFYPYAEKIRHQVSMLPQVTPAYGLIHADLHGNNIFFDAEVGLTLIDFDHCAYGWRAYDIAPGITNSDLSDMLLAGYESVRAFSNLEKELMSTFTHLRDIWDIGDILYYKPLWGQTPSDEELEKSVARLHNLMKQGIDSN
ncbi:MAG: phosphotransferase [Chloroflexota bacterium]